MVLISKTGVAGWVPSVEHKRQHRQLREAQCQETLFVKDENMMNSGRDLRESHFH